jgi:hypothetical protein
MVILKLRSEAVELSEVLLSDGWQHDQLFRGNTVHVPLNDRQRRTVQMNVDFDSAILRFTE